jgi:hypothetical protein
MAAAKSVFARTIIYPPSKDEKTGSQQGKRTATTARQKTFRWQLLFSVGFAVVVYPRGDDCERAGAVEWDALITFVLTR